LGEPVRQSEHPENFEKITKGDVAVAVFEILVGRPGKTGPPRHFNLRPILFETVLPQSVQKQADGFSITLQQ
jgi:hypothetical protein